MEATQQIQDIVGILEEIKEDQETPKKVKEKVEKVIHELTSNKEVSLAAHNAINELDGIAENSNMQSYTRSQIWHVVSMLESL